MRIHRKNLQIVPKFCGKTEPKWCKITSGQTIFGHGGDFGRFGRSWEGPGGVLGAAWDGLLRLLGGLGALFGAALTTKITPTWP